MSTAAMTFDERYRAIESRDRRFDGQFVTAVLVASMASISARAGPTAASNARRVLSV